MKPVVKFALWLFLALALAAGGIACGGNSGDDDSSAADDDDNDDNNDNDDNDNDDDQSPTDDDSSPLPDDYVAPWPQSNVEPRDYDESPTAGPLRQKAGDYDAWHIAWHEPYHGGSVDAVFTDASRTTVAAYGGWGDSCIWTGTYLGSQAMRYYVTNDAGAKANAIAMVHTLDGFLHVTGRPGFIARYWGMQDSLMYQGQSWCESQDRCHHVDSGPYAGDFWWGETSRDQYTGWFFGMAMAYDLIDDEPTRTMIRADVAEVVNALIDQHWWIIDEGGQPTDAGPNIIATQQMTWSAIAYHITGDARFKTELQKWLLNAKREALRLSNLTFMNRYAQYYGNNLGHTNWFNLLRLGKVYFSKDDYDFLLSLFESQTHTFTRLSHNPWFNGIFMGQGAYAPRPPSDPYQSQLVGDLTDFMPAPSVDHHVPARTGYPLDSVSVMLYELEQALPWLSDIIGSVDEQAEHAFPIPLQCPGGFLFQENPFEVYDCGTDDPTAVSPGADYLVAYWLAAYQKFVTKEQ